MSVLIYSMRYSRLKIILEDDTELQILLISSACVILSKLFGMSLAQTEGFDSQHVYKIYYDH